MVEKSANYLRQNVPTTLSVVIHERRAEVQLALIQSLERRFQGVERSLPNHKIWIRPSL